MHSLNLGVLAWIILKRSVLVEVKPLSSIHEDATFIFNVGSRVILDWMRDIIQYKESGEFLVDLVLARKLKLKSLQFVW